MDIKELMKDTAAGIRQWSKEKGSSRPELMKLNKMLGAKRTVIVAGVAVGAVVLFACNLVINLYVCILRGDFTGIFLLRNFFRIQITKLNGFALFLYLLAIVFSVAVGIRTAYKWAISYREENIGQKGTSSFAMLDEIKIQYREIPEQKTSFEGKGGLPVAHIGDRIYIDDSNTNTLCIGITRSGKGEMFVLPMIDIYSRSAEKPSMIIVDMKNELLCASYCPLKERGYDVIPINMEYPDVGYEINPLDLITRYYMDGKIEDAEFLCNSFGYTIFSGNAASADANSEFFLDNATSAVAALIIAHLDDCYMQDLRELAEAKTIFVRRQAAFEKLSEDKKEKIREDYFMNPLSRFTAQEIRTREFIPSEEVFKDHYRNMEKVTLESIINTFTNLGREYIDDRTTKLDVFFQRRPPLDRAKAIYASIEVSGDRTKGSIFSQALTKLNLYSYENMRRLTSRSTFNVEDLGFGERPIALFIGVPFYDRSKDSFVSTLVDQIFQANSRRAAAEPGLTCKRRIIFHLDEFGQFPPVQSMDTMLSVGLGINIIFNLFIQAYSQIDDKYGEQKAKTIRGNCGNQVFVQTIEYETAEYFSKLLGNETITNITRSGEKLSTKKTITELYDEHPLLNPNQLMALMEGENVIKRVMRRRDLNSRKVEPKAIFNTVSNGTDFRYRHEYLEDFCGTSTLAQIKEDKKEAKEEGKNAPYDYNITMNKFAFEWIGEQIKAGNPEISPEDMLFYDSVKEVYRYDRVLDSFANGRSVLNTCRQKGLSLDGADCAAKAACRIADSVSLSIMEKDLLLSLLETY